MRKRRKYSTGLYATGTIFLLVTTSIGQQSDGILPSEVGRIQTQQWRLGVACGPNALYLYLRSWGWQGSLDSVFDAVTVRVPEGTSFFELAKASCSLGVPSQLVRVPLSELGRRGWPVLVHQETADVNGSTVGHFMLMVGMHDDRDGTTIVELIDPLSLASTEIVAHEFQKCWTGVALLPTPSAWWRVNGEVLFAMGNIVLSVYLVQHWKRQRIPR